MSGRRTLVIGLDAFERSIAEALISRGRMPNLARLMAESARGIANWGSHDAGVPRTTRPAELWSEIEGRFGSYPAEAHIYGIVWSSADRTQRMADELIAAVELRRRIARWLLSERLPDWDLAILALSELHSVVETMWHGWDPEHPLHHASSARGAREAVVGVYAAVDRLIGDLTSCFPDATTLAFASHGMGPNHSDVAAMILMAELMHRHTTGRTAFRPSDTAREAVEWSDGINRSLVIRAPRPTRDRLLSRLGIKRPRRPEPPFDHPLDWMPTARYRRAWPRMKAFAIPAYHDARIRLSVRGRESGGLVRQRDYRRTLDEVAEVVRQCRDIADGRPLDAEIDYTSLGDPLAISGWQADIVIRLKRNVLGIRHPDLGEIGPVPHRRTGGHTGQYGVAYLKGPAIAPGDRGVFSTFDVTQTVIDQALHRPPRTALGKALHAKSAAPTRQLEPVR